MLIYVYRLIEHNTGCKTVLGLCEIIYIDAATNYYVILIIYKSPNNILQTAYQEVHSNYVFHKEIHIKIIETCRNIQGTPL